MDVCVDVSESFETFYECAETAKKTAYSQTLPGTNRVYRPELLGKIGNELYDRFRRARASSSFNWPGFLVSGDNEAVCNTLAGRYMSKAHRTQGCDWTDGVDWGARAIGDLNKLYKAFGLQPTPGESSNFVWRPRAQNTLADALANRALDEGNILETFDAGFQEMVQDLVRGAAGGYTEDVGWFWARFDGAARVSDGSGEGESSFGLAIDWMRGQTRHPIFRESWRLGHGSAYRARLRGAARATNILLSIFTRLADTT